MPYKVRLWKMDFFKNNSIEGGAMKIAIENRKHGEVVIHSHTKKNGRAWGSTEPAKLLSLLESNHGLYEVITDFPHKVYFDVDDDKETPTPLDVIKQHILTYFPSAEFAISGSVTEKKTSYHIILSNYLIRNIEDRITMKHIVKKLQETDSAFDWKVYTPNRNMKCINQSKDDGRVQQIIECPDFRQHLITCFFSTSPLPFPELPEETQLEIQIDKSKSAFDITSLPKMILAPPNEFDASDILSNGYDKILALLPLNKSFNHDYTHLVARFCFYNGLSLETFLSWLQNKHSDIQTVTAKWTTHWKNLSKFPPVSGYKIITILKYFYPTLLKPKYFQQFQNAFILPEDKICRINRIDQSHFNVPQKAILFDIGMGQGKTAQTNQFLKGLNQKRFIWITPNIALARNTYKRMCDIGIECIFYQDVKTHQKSTIFQDDTKNLIICANSLHYVGNRTFDTIVIDESETFLNKWYGDFMDKTKKTKRINWEVLMNLFNNANFMIFLDAFTSRLSVDFIRNFANDNFIIYQLNEPQTIRDIEYIESFATMKQMMFNDIKKGKKVFAFYPFKNRIGDKYPSMSDLYETIIQLDKKAQYYNADQDDKIKKQIEDVNMHWADLDAVICNQAITCGVNFDIGSFDICYLFIGAFNSARDILQVSARARQFTTNKIRACFLSGHPIDAYQIDIDRMNHPVYTQTFKNILVEKKAPLKDSVHFLCTKAGYRQRTIKKDLVKQLKLEHIDIIQSADCQATYENIPPISYEESQHIQNCMFANCATMLQKFQLQRFFFDASFKSTSDTIAGEPALQFIWNNHLLNFCDILENELIKGETSLLHQIANANGYNDLIPPEDLFDRSNRNKIVIPNKDAVFNQYRFKHINALSAPALILKGLINEVFQKHVITTHCTLDKHTKYCIEDSWYELMDFFIENTVTNLSPPPAVEEQKPERRDIVTEIVYTYPPVETVKPVSKSDIRAYFGKK